MYDGIIAHYLLVSRTDDILAKQKRRKREELKKHLLEVGGELLADKGFSSLTIEEIAGRAGVHKSQIYRTFEDIDNLKKVIYEANTAWPSFNSLAEKAGASKSLCEYMISIFDAIIESIGRSKTAEILRWELAENEEFIKSEFLKRQELSNHVLNYAKHRYPEDIARLQEKGIDIGAFSLAMIGSMIYANIRLKRSTGEFYGMDITLQHAREATQVTILETVRNTIKLTLQDG